jgi:ATP-dependent DNA helicase DinG
VPGPSLALVTIDRLPFPRPDEPLLQARRERARADAFRVVDLPRAATMLAQGAGRLIRTASDRGVVAVLDPRLATNASYRWDIVSALPPMRRTRDRAEAEAFLAEIASGIPDPGTRLRHDEVPEAAEATDERRRTPT